ncbi:MAG TPA: hypothetical protein VKB86_11230 [Pyrinomonadaceae bacterium]|nr:hypothetical protein [Pyrinomonadaceae bacterium]
MVFNQPFGAQGAVKNLLHTSRKYVISGPAAGIEAEGSGIKEVIPDRYEKRYLRWKSEYLSTEAGREQWQTYSERTDFLLTITVSSELKQGAESGGYEWDESGRLVKATIRLGDEIDKGYPTSINYPVTCSLAPGNLPGGVNGTILAAAKIAHEFGHVNNTAAKDASLYQTQNRLILEFQQIFKSNGFNIDDPRLAEIVRQLGDTPTHISQEREYEAEANVVSYLREKFSEGGQGDSLPKPIERAINSFYRSYLRE